jgi:hypothetical protein
MIGFSICLHRRTSFPISPPRLPGQYRSEPYVICLGCGKSWAYDWEKMRRGRALTQRNPLTESMQGEYSEMVRVGRERLQDGR